MKGKVGDRIRVTATYEPEHYVNGNEGKIVTVGSSASIIRFDSDAEPHPDAEFLLVPVEYELIKEPERAPQVGDRIRVTAPDRSSLAQGYEIGDLGNITEVIGEDTRPKPAYAIQLDKFDDHEQDGLYADEFEVVSEIRGNKVDVIISDDLVEHDYKKGDRIILTAPDELTKQVNGLLEGTLGTVRNVLPFERTVLEIDWDNGRDYAVYADEVSPYTKPQFKVGDRVRIISQENESSYNKGDVGTVEAVSEVLCVVQADGYQYDQGIMHKYLAHLEYADNIDYKVKRPKFELGDRVIVNNKVHKDHSRKVGDTGVVHSNGDGNIYTVHFNDETVTHINGDWIDLIEVDEGPTTPIKPQVGDMIKVVETSALDVDMKITKGDLGRVTKTKGHDVLVVEWLATHKTPETNQVVTERCEIVK